MKAFIVQVTLLLIFCTTQGQNQALIDSLNRQISTTNSDSLKIKYLNEIAAHYLFTNTVGTRQPAFEAFKLAEKTQNFDGMMDALNRIGIMHYRLAEFDSSLIYYKKALVFAEANYDTTRITKYRGNIALSYSSQAKYQEAMKMYFELIEIQKTHNPVGVARSLLDIASIYFHLKDYKQALSNAQEAKAIAEQFNDKTIIANACNSIGVFSEELGDISKALEYYNLSLQLKIELDDKLGQLNSLINIAKVYNKIKLSDKAIAINDSVIVLGRDIGATRQQADAYANNGALYAELGESAKATTCYTKAFDLYTQIGALEFMVDLAGKLADSYIQLNDSKNAALLYKKQAVLKDSLYSKNMATNIAEMRTKYETEKKESDNKILLQENNLKEAQVAKRNIVILVMGISIVLIFSVVLWRINAINLRKKAHELETNRKIQIEKERISRDLHDNIGSMVSFISTKVDWITKNRVVEPDLVKDLSLVKTNAKNLINSLRETLWTLNSEKITNFELVDKLKPYINSNLLIPYSINDKLELESILEPELVLNIYRSCQEIINNINKHSKASRVLIQFSNQNNSKLSITIADNGIGFSEADEYKENHYGIRNLKARLNNAQIKLDINTEPNKGTTLCINVY